MKFNKISKRLAACSLVGVMMVSMLGMTAFAAESGYKPDNGATAVHFNKVLNMDEATGANTPGVTFNYTIKAGDKIAATTTTPEIKAGVGSPTIEGVTYAVGDSNLTKQATVNFKDVVFSAPGIYRYIITETKRTDANTIYENINYDAVADRYLDVYVENILDAEGEVEGYTITHSVLTEEAINPVQSGDNITYGDGNQSKSEGYENAYKTWDLTVDKTIKGTMANHADTFKFEIVISGMQEKATVTVGQKTYEADAAGNIKIEAELGDGQDTKIEGIPSNASYTITEKLNGTEGYTTSIEAKDSAKADGATVSADMDAENEEVHYTNTKNAVTPTGVAMTVAPYILMVAVAGIFAILFLRRRHEEA